MDADGPPRHRISAGAIVVRDDRVLLVRHRREGVDDFWVAPGGGVEGDESLDAVETDWFSHGRIAAGRETVFPPMLADPSWLDRRVADAGSPRVLPLRRMEVW